MQRAGPRAQIMPPAVSFLRKTGLSATYLEPRVTQDRQSNFRGKCSVRLPPLSFPRTLRVPG